MSAKRKRRVLRAILGAALWAAPAALLATASPAQAALCQVPAFIHFQTKISTGHYPPEDLISKIHERGIGSLTGKEKRILRQATRDQRQEK